MKRDHATRKGRDDGAQQSEARREAKRAYLRAYYQKNREALLARGKERYQEIREAKLAYGKAYRQKNLEEIRKRDRERCPKRREAKRAYNKAYYQKNREAQRIRVLAQKYTLTAEQYEAMYAAQSGKCVLCQRQPERSLVVDHCHVTGAVRGLLCNNCNSDLASADLDMSWLERAGAYLRHPPARRIMTSGKGVE